MAKAKPKPKSPFTGRWRIVSMSAWDEDFIDEEEEGFFEFDEKGGGEFHFGYAHGQLDCRLTTPDGEPAVEWTWDGNDEMDHAEGRGWAVLKGDELHGTIFFHEGDDSGFVANRVEGKRGKKAIPEDTDNSNKAFLELVRVLEEAVRAGADSLGMEYEGRDLIVYYNFGNTGLGAARIPKELQQKVIEEIVKKTGLSRKSKGKMQVQLLGKDYEAAVAEYDSFGESAFTITLKERKKKAGR
jgi:hypothetical protein